MDSQGQVTILDYLRVIWRAWWWILALTALAAVVAFGYGRSQPKVYAAKATILPPRESGSQSFSMSLGALFLGGAGGGRDGGGLNVPGISLGMPSLSTNQDIFVALLKSRTMREEVVAEFSRTWGAPVGSMVLSVQPDTKDKGVVGLVVEAMDPNLAADVANYYFAHLDRMLERYSEQASGRQEKSYAAQLERAASEVETAERALLKFQSENRVPPLDAAARGAVESGGSLRGFIMGLEMQREIMRMRFTDQHPQMREMEKQIAELKRQYSKNLFGEAMDLPPESPTARGGRKEFFVAAAKMTPVQFAFLKLYRNLKIQEAFYTAALQGLQQIKYADGFSHVRVEVLDPALPPSGPSRPNVLSIVQRAAVGALIVGILLAFVLEYLRGVREQERQRRRSGPARRRLEDRLGPSKIPEGERARVLEPEGAPAGVSRGVLTSRQE